MLKQILMTFAGFLIHLPLSCVIVLLIINFVVSFYLSQRAAHYFRLACDTRTSRSIFPGSSAEFHHEKRIFSTSKRRYLLCMLLFFLSGAMLALLIARLIV